MELFKRKTENTDSVPKAKLSIKQKKAKSLPPFITIDVGSHDVKVMYATYAGKALTVKKCACIELPEKVVVDGKIVDETALVNAVMHVIQTHKISVSGAVVTLASSEVIQREITVPVVSDDNLKKVVMYEMAKFLPVDADTYAIQHEVLENINDENGIAQLRVSVSAMPKAIAKKYYEFVSKLGLKPIALCTNSNSVANLMLAETYCDAPIALGTNILLDMGSAHFGVTLFEEGTLLYNNILNVGGKEIDELIMNYADVGLLDAEKLKKHNLSVNNVSNLYSAYVSLDIRNSSYGTKEERIMQEIMSVFSKWVTAIDSFAKYYLSRDDNNTIDAIYIYGGSSYINGIDELLEKQLKIKVHRVDALGCLKGSLGDGGGLCKYINNIGATIRF